MRARRPGFLTTGSRCDEIAARVRLRQQHHARHREIKRLFLSAELALLIRWRLNRVLYCFEHTFFTVVFSSSFNPEIQPGLCFWNVSRFSLIRTCLLLLQRLTHLDIPPPGLIPPTPGCGRDRGRSAADQKSQATRRDAANEGREEEKREKRERGQDSADVTRRGSNSEPVDSESMEQPRRQEAIEARPGKRHSTRETNSIERRSIGSCTSTNKRRPKMQSRNLMSMRKRRSQRQPKGTQNIDSGAGAAAEEASAG